MKKFLLPFQNMVRADLFFRQRRICLWHDSSLAVWNALGFAIHFARPPIPSPDCEAIADEGSPEAEQARYGVKIPFELIQEYTANWENANLKKLARGAERAARIGFERAFLAKRKRIYQ